MTGRPMRTKLPGLQGVDQPDVSTSSAQFRDSDALAKLRSKEAADKRRGARSSDIAVGDTVLIDTHRQVRNKLTPNFDTTPYTVVARHGSEIVAEGEDGREVRRNVSVAKKLIRREVEQEVRERETEVDEQLEPSPEDRESTQVAESLQSPSGSYQPMSAAADPESLIDPSGGSSLPTSSDPGAHGLGRSRPARVTKPPERFRDFVM